MGKPSSINPDARDLGSLFLPANQFGGVTALVSAVANVGDTLDTVFVPPADLSTGSDISFHVVYATDQVTADTIDWIVTLDFAEPETTAVLPIVPATALDTAVPQDTCSATANGTQMTAAGVLSGAGTTALLMKPPFSFATSGVDQIVKVGLRVELDAYGGTLPGDTVNFAGVVMHYTRESI